MSSEPVLPESPAFPTGLPSAASAAAEAGPGVGRAALIAYGNFVFRHRNALVPVAVVLLVLLTRPRPLGGNPRYDVLLDALGFAVALCGQAVRVLVIGLAYIRRGGLNKRIAAYRLVTDGVFAHCRHPLYLGNLLLFSGLMIIWNAPAAYVFGIGGVALTLFAMAIAEETFLRRKFGAEYDAYCARVRRFVPRLRGLRQTIGGFDFNWKRVLRKEYGTTFSWMTTALVLVVLGHVEWQGAAGAAPTVQAAALGWLVLAALWGWARWMKKTRRLVSPD